MIDPAVLSRVKRATVALAIVNDGNAQRPFEIIGSGACLDPRGVIVTCRHVIEGFMANDYHSLVSQYPEIAKTGAETESIVPYALFYDLDSTAGQLRVIAARADTSQAHLRFDLGLIRVHPHDHFKGGFPTLTVEPFGDITEGMDVATCGFPLGNGMFEQLGTRTSSFTKGMVSSVIPAASVEERHIQGFQLDLTATHDNSGGPVFSTDTGGVLGVIQGGVINARREIVQGFVKAEPVYPMVWDNNLDLFARAPNTIDEFLRFREQEGLGS